MRTWGTHRLVAVVAHVALLLALCVPVASRVLMPAGMNVTMDCGSMAMAGHDMAMPMVDGMMTLHAGEDAGHASRHPPHGRSPGDACAYCSLFAHLPCVMAIAATLATLPQLPTWLFPASRVVLEEPSAHLAFRPRGPPQSLVFA